MSTNIEQNVVEMQFNNKNFETNVKQSMSTLDELKSKLNFNTSVKSVEQFDKAVKGITFATATNGAETLRLKISALGVAGVTAIQGITNSIMGMSKTMLNAVTGMGAIKGGFAEYQTQLGAIQTIMANTSSKGTTLDEVNAALDTLNDYADLTIYNFTEMTRNIGTFTAAGVDLDTAVSSIKGIANLAAASGSTSVQASTAMYQLSQAIAAGKVQLMDWNSVVNAGMGGELFQNALKRTAEHFGTDVDGMIAKYGSFRESLTQGGWLTVDVLTETLKQISGAYTESDLIAQGYTQDQAKAISDLADTATNAATKVKTFAELWDTIQEAAGSGWTKTWSLFFGDFEYARENLTWFADYFSNIVGGMSDSRNDLLEPALNSNWNKLIDQIHDAGFSTDTFSTKLKENMKNNGYDVDGLLKKYGTLENVFKSGEVTTDSLRQTIDELGGSISDLADISGTFSFGAGFDSASGDENVKKIQTQLKNLGYDLGEFGENADGVDGQLGSMTEAAIRAFQEANGLEVNGIIDDATLEALRQSVDDTDSLSGKVSDLIDNIDQLGGRDLIFQGLKNILNGISEVAGVVSTAFNNIFPPLTSDLIYNAAESFEKFTEKLTLNEETSEKLQTIFEGLFSALNIVFTLVSGPLKIAFTILNGVCEVYGTSLLDVFERVGRALTNANDFITKFFKIDSVSSGIRDFVQGAIDAFKNLRNYLKRDFDGDLTNVFDPLLMGASNLMSGLYDAIQNTPIGSAVDFIKSTLDGVIEYFTSIDFSNFGIGDNFIQGIVNGIQNGIGNLISSASEIAENILNTVKGLLGIHSPSTEGESIGENFIQGIINGIGNLISNLWESAKNVANTMAEGVSSIDFSVFIPIAVLGGIIAAIVMIKKKISSAVEGASGPLGSIKDFFDTLNDSLKLDEKVKKSSAIKNYAIAIGILVAAISALAYMVSKDMNSVLIATGIIAGFIILVGILSIAISKLGGDGKALSGAGSMFNAIAAMLASLAIVVKILGEMETNQLAQGVVAAGILIVFVAALLTVNSALSKWSGAASSLNASMFVGIAVVLLAMTAVVKALGGMDRSSLEQGLEAVAVFSILITAMIAVSKISSGAKGVGTALLGVAVALGTMAAITFLMSFMNPEAFDRGLSCVIALSIVVAALLVVTGIASRIAGGNTLPSLLGVSAVLIVMAALTIIFSAMDPNDFQNGLNCIIALTSLLSALLVVTGIASRIAGGNTLPSLLGVSAVLIVMAAIVVILGNLDSTALSNGIYALEAMSVCLTMLMLALGTLGEKKVSIVPIISIIGILAAITACIYVIASVPTESATAASAAISLVLLDIAGMLLILTNLKAVSGKAMISVAVVTAILLVIAGIFVALDALDVNTSLETAGALSIVLIAMAAMLAILSAIGPTSTGALAAAGAFDGVVVIIGGLLVAIGALMTYVPECQDFLTIGLEVLKQIFTGIGEAFGGLVNGFLTGATENIEDIGTRLSNFMTNCQPFIEGAKNIDASAVTGVGYLSAAILEITGTELLNSIADFFTGESSIDSFCDDIVKLAAGLKGFSDGLSGIDQAALMLGSAAARSLAETVDAIPAEGGFADFIFGTRDIDEFCFNIIKIADALKTFSETLSGIDNGALILGASAAQGLASMVDAIPSEGGFADYIFGTKNIQGFVDSLPAFGAGLASFATSITGLTASDTDVANAASLCDTIAEMNDSVPTTGGLAGMIFGDKNMGSFGTNAQAFGEGLAGFATAISNISVPKNVDSLSPIMDILDDMDDIVGREGGLIDKLTGTVQYDDFSKNAGSFAAGISSFANGLDKFPTEVNYDNVQTCVEALSKMNETIPSTGGVVGFFMGNKNIGDFGKQARNFGTGIRSFARACTDFPNDINFDGVKACTEALANMGNVVGNSGGVIGNFVTWLAGDVDYEAFTNNAGDYIQAIADFGTAAADIPDGAVNKMTTVSAITDELSKMGSVVAGGEWWQQLLNFFTGEQDYTEFKINAANYAEAIKDFAINCAEIPTDVNFDAVASTSQALADMGNILKNNPSGIDFWGNDRFESLSSNAESFAGCLKDFAGKCVGIETSGLDGAKTAVECVSEISQNEVMNNGDKLEQFGSKLASFGGKLGDFQSNSASFDADRMKAIVDSLNGLNSIATSNLDFSSIDLSGMSSALTDAMTNVDVSKASESMNSAGSTMGKSIAVGLDSSGTNIANSLSKIIDNCVSMITSSISKFKNCGTNIINGIASGVNSSALLNSNIASQINSAANLAMGYYWTFYSAGSNMGAGLLDGINSKLTQVENAAARLANKAAEAVRVASQIHSPSRVWAKIGGFMGEGLANGIRATTSAVRLSSMNLASTANNSLLNALAVYDEFSSLDLEMDADPVIRPVVDLTDIQNGQRYIDNMFGYVNSGRINASMNAMVTPASNDDVINAIDKLGNHIDNMPRNNYSVGDISYDDGTATARAVSELTRAVRIRRRS